MSLTITGKNQAIISLQVQFNTKVTISDLSTKEFEKLVQDKTNKIESFTKTVLSNDLDIEKLVVSELKKIIENSGFSFVEGKIVFDSDFLKERLDIKQLKSEVPFLPISSAYVLNFDKKKFEDNFDFLKIDNKYIVKNSAGEISVDVNNLLADAKGKITELFNNLGFISKTDKYLKFDNRTRKLEIRVNLLKKDLNTIDSPYFYKDSNFNNVLDFSKLKYDLFDNLIDNNSLVLKNGVIQVDYKRFVNLIEEKIDALKVTGLNNEKMINAFNFGINECKTLINNQVVLNHYVAGEILELKVSNFKCSSNSSGEYYQIRKSDYILTGKTITLTFNPFIVFWNAKILYLYISYIPLQNCNN